MDLKKTKPPTAEQLLGKQWVARQKGEEVEEKKPIDARALKEDAEAIKKALGVA